MPQSVQSLFTVSEIDIVYRNKVKPDDRIKISNGDSAYDVFISAWDLNKIDLVEQFYVLFLDRSNHCLGLSNISTGGMSGCIADPKIVFAMAVKAKASAMILAHNHPSGNLRPSTADIQLTQQFREAGKFLDLQVWDHLIITPLKYFSFAEEGLIL